MSRVASTREAVSKFVARVESTTAGRVHRRVGELDMLNQAAILAAIAMVSVIPALITVVAVLPVGRDHGLVVSWQRHLALGAPARAALRALFKTPNTQQSNITAISALITIVSAYAWPAALQRAYGRIWGHHTKGLRELWRPILRVPSLFCLIAAVGASGFVVSGVAGALATGLVGIPLTFGWSWWTQHLLLSGRIRWRALVPGALATAIGLCGMSVFSAVYLSAAITYNYGRYGSVGTVFVIMPWLTVFSTIMLIGALVGHTIC